MSASQALKPMSNSTIFHQPTKKFHVTNKWEANWDFTYLDDAVFSLQRNWHQDPEQSNIRNYRWASLSLGAEKEDICSWRAPQKDIKLQQSFETYPWQ